MRRTALLWLAAVATGLGASSALAQGEPVPENPKPEPAPTSTLGGTSARDLIRLDGKALSIPLRNAGIVNGSESLELDGRPLKRGEDYSIDYPTGTVMLMVPVPQGSSLRASYRHDKTLAKNSNTNAGSSLTQLKLSFAPGTSASFGLGMVERDSGGRVTQMDLYAFRNNMKSTGRIGFGMNGILALSNRREVQSSSLMGGARGPGEGSLGQGTAIVQDLSASLGKGNISLGYQEITKDFSGFAALSANGYDEATINSLQKERGLKRLSYNVNQLDLGALQFSNSMQSVSDGKQGITTRGFQLASNGFKIGNNSRKVDQGFKRFDDLREGDRGTLKLEAGLQTDEWFAELSRNHLNMSLQSKAVEDGNGKGFERQSFSAKSGLLMFNYGSQRIDTGFNRLNGTREQNWQQLAREQGLARESFGLNLGPIARQLQGLDIASSHIRSDQGRFHALDLNARGTVWSVEHYNRSFDQGFTRLHSLSENELNQHLTTVAKMYEPTGVGFRPEDRGALANSRGLDRSFTRFQFSPGQGIGIRFDHLALNGLTDTGTATMAQIRAPKTEFGMRLTHLGNDLNEVRSLMSFESARLGNVAGVRKNDLWLNTEIGNMKVNASTMRAAKGGEDAERDSIGLSTKGFSLSFNRRSVDNGFGSIGQLVDPERELLNQMRGEEQRQIQLDWVMARNLSVKLNWTSGGMVDERDARLINNHSFLSWQPDALTRLEYYAHDEKWSDSTNTLVDNKIQRTMFARSLPNFGSLRVEHETRQFFGENAPADSVRNTVMVEGSINQTTKLRSEATATKFDNGDREDIRAHTLETSVLKQAGVAVTDTTIDRNNARPDERKRNYGFWIDFGKGLRMNYGYQSDTNEAANGTRQSQFGLTSGTFGNLTFGGANYQSQQWDRSRQRSLGNFSLQTNKPVQLGFLRDAQFKFATDTIRDYDLWQREQNMAAVAGKLLGSNAAFEYLSQFSPHHRGRAIDRTFRWQNGNDKTLMNLNVMYKHRTMPDDRTFAIRDVTASMKVGKEATLSHAIKSYPEVQRGDALLGSVLQPTRMVQWRLDQQAKGQDTLFGVSWREDLNEQTKEMKRMASLHLTLFANNPSPLKLSYGLEQGDLGNRRETAHRYELQFNQRPGPNQNFSLYLGNVSWQHLRNQDTHRENWTMRLEWQVRF